MAFYTFPREKVTMLALADAHLFVLASLVTRQNQPKQLNNREQFLQSKYLNKDNKCHLTLA